VRIKGKKGICLLKETVLMMVAEQKKEEEKFMTLNFDTKREFSQSM
jgi:hypothetical protein